ncbi:S16 family serine protease [Maridesulfovibrio hydrothermalis]|uniref:endopeptidase La n=1 Tax=Maridesulfovibrio hydrothermalis AM13 = DSM 14728 TaxID=1121451 RepID=L0RFJ5_9BACT|nr:S16 family serine protease [Maridesulfovibrio hydrothermalis]CCO25524.1 Response regulator receiver protein [Maridesulfovibrio hydrothermalis AM13 = DSM 14728]
MKWFRKKSDNTSQSDPEISSDRKESSPPSDPFADELRKRMESAGLPDHIRIVARDEYERLVKTDKSSPEFALAHNYLEFILSLPWNVTTKDDLDLTRAKDLLDARHYGLSIVKERILEFLAVKSLHSRQHAKILLADDEVIARENLSIIFEGEGFDVTAVANGLEAITAMEKDPADILVTDLKMDGMDGLQLLQEVRRRWPDTGVIMLTGYATVKSAVSAMLKGADQYLGKPVNLTKLRDYVMELLSRNQRIQSLRGPVLCFTGPPGTGKTSIGKAIAEAMGRKFFRLSLAGLRDEAELRGHRRTYVGAMAGRILQGIQKTGVRNPVIMLDEMDKVIGDSQGDATAVLLEMLDPEQNSSFVDNYLGQPFDLSGVLFIATANIVERIPAPLRDRMEEIEFSSYTLSEKQEIATRFLIPSQLRQHGLNPGEVDLQAGAVKKIILDYTREAGLRGLEKQVAALCRKLARKVLDGGESSGVLKVEGADIQNIMGSPPHFTTTAKSAPKVGLATGLVWTENGGEILFVEAAQMRGNKQLILTGSLGDVLQESAQTALSFLRSSFETFNLSPEFFESSDIHVHIPAGAVTKEGPSAGVTITVAILSMLTGRPVRQDVAFSGEISLLGDVLPVGGIREKVMAATRAGIKTVVLPEKCDQAVRSIESEVLENIEVRLVSRLEEVVELALL